LDLYFIYILLQFQNINRNKIAEEKIESDPQNTLHKINNWFFYFNYLFYSVFCLAFSFLFLLPIIPPSQLLFAFLLAIIIMVAKKQGKLGRRKEEENESKNKHERQRKRDEINIFNLSFSFSFPFVLFTFLSFYYLVSSLFFVFYFGEEERNKRRTKKTK